MFRFWISTAVAALALIAVAAAQADRGVRPAEPAGKYMTGIVKQKLTNEYELAWESLYPRHQRIASLEAYVACESLTPPAGNFVAIKVMRPELATSGDFVPGRRGTDYRLEDPNGRASAAQRLAARKARRVRPADEPAGLEWSDEESAEWSDDGDDPAKDEVGAGIAAEEPDRRV